VKRLSPSQLRVLTYVAEGWPNWQIAQQLHLSLNTVKSHLDQISERLGTTGRAHAVAVAFRTGQLS
jgi:DNA-binding NarL/FixJ family response regulator